MSNMYSFCSNISEVLNLRNKTIPFPNILSPKKGQKVHNSNHFLFLQKTINQLLTNYIIPKIYMYTGI